MSNYKNPFVKLADKVNRKVLGGVEKRIVKKSDNKALAKEAIEKMHDNKTYVEILDKSAKRGGAVLTIAAILGAGAASGIGAGASGGGSAMSKGGAFVSKAKKAKKYLDTALPVVNKIAEPAKPPSSQSVEEKLLSKGVIPGENDTVTNQVLENIVNTKPDDERLNQILAGDESASNENETVFSSETVMPDNKKLAKSNFMTDNIIFVIIGILILLTFGSFSKSN